MVFPLGATGAGNIERAIVLLRTRTSCILRKRGAEEQTANADEYSLDDKMRICRLGRNPIIRDEQLLYQLDLLLCHHLGGNKTGNREYQVKQARLGELLGSVRINGHDNGFRVLLRKQRQIWTSLFVGI